MGYSFHLVAVAVLCTCCAAGLGSRSLAVSPAYDGLPYVGVPLALPGVLEPELFDAGGEGVAYFELPGAPGLPPNVIRVEETVQVNDVGPATGGSEEPGTLAVGMVVAGEWLRYTVEATQQGIFLPSYRIASFSPVGDLNPVAIKLVLGAEVEAEPCAAEGVGALNLPGVNTGDWKDFETFDGEEFELLLGTHVITVCFDDVLGFEIESIEMQLVEETFPVEQVVPPPVEEEAESEDQVQQDIPPEDQFFADEDEVLLPRDPRCKEGAPCDPNVELAEPAPGPSAGSRDAEADSSSTSTSSSNSSNAESDRLFYISTLVASCAVIAAVSALWIYSIVSARRRKRRLPKCAPTPAESQNQVGYAGTCSLSGLVECGLTSFFSLLKSPLQQPQQGAQQRGHAPPPLPPRPAPAYNV
ncbi:unnamed protein product [Chrysoparadoxa australica]